MTVAELLFPKVRKSLDPPMDSPVPLTVTAAELPMEMASLLPVRVAVLLSPRVTLSLAALMISPLPVTVATAEEPVIVI